MREIEKFLEVGTLEFSRDEKYFSVVFSPNDDFNHKNRATVLFRRKTLSNIYKDLELFLSQKEKSVTDYPANFFDPDFRDF